MGRVWSKQGGGGAARTGFVAAGPQVCWEYCAEGSSQSLRALDYNRREDGHNVCATIKCAPPLQSGRNKKDWYRRMWGASGGQEWAFMVKRESHPDLSVF